MSTGHERISDAHFEYIAARTRGDDDFLRALNRAADEAGIPSIRIGAVQASFLQVLLKAAAAREVVEIGSLAGYSAICMARALPPGGRVRTIELDPARAAFVEEWVAKSDVADRVEVLRGAGADVLPTFADASADAAFLDADKGNYPLYLRECLRVVRPGGLILVDNAFAFGELFAADPQDPETPAIRAFNDEIARTPGLHPILVPFGDGLWVAVRE